MTENVTNQLPKTGPEHQRLEIFIGKWINQGHTIASADAPEVSIPTSDVYEWMPGGFFVLHTAYGRIGNLDVGGTDILGYNVTSSIARTSLTVRATSVPMNSRLAVTLGNGVGSGPAARRSSLIMAKRRRLTMSA